MIYRILMMILLVAQGVPATSTKAPPKGSISGVVLNNATGDPLANVRVTLARTDSTVGMDKAVRGLIGGPESGRMGEVVVPAEFLDSMKQEIAAEVASMREAVRQGQVPPEEFPPEMEQLANMDLDGVHSIMVDSTGKLAVIPKGAPPMTTDASGKFEFHDLPAGAYRLIFAANGYVRQDYGQRGLGGGTPLLLDAGKTIDNLVTRMSPTGTISGRISNNRGQPVAAVSVQLSRFAYDATGKRKPTPVLSTQTNDRGEYRFFHLTPGRYILSAGTQGTSARDYYGYGYGAYGYALGLPGGGASQNRVMDQRFVPSYYPGTPDANSAAAIEVTPSGSVHDVNLNLAAEGAFTVRGSVLDPRGGAAPQSASIRLMPQDGNIVNPRGGPNYNPADGTFEMRDVPAGSYLLIVEMQNRTAQPQPQRGAGPRTEAEQIEYQIAMQQAAAEGRLRASVPIVVDNSDVDGIVVTPAVGGFLNGRIRVEGAVTGKPLQLNRVGTEFRPVGPDGSPMARPGLQPQPQNPRPDGTFRVNSVYSGEYWFRIRNLPEGYYVKSARVGEADALNHPMMLPVSDANLVLDVVISPNVGQLEGSAVLADGRPAAGAQVVLVPDRNRERTELFKPMNADASGRFSIANIEPGEYHVAVWPSMEPFAFFDPGFIAQAQEKGKAIRVGESSKQKINVEAFADAP